MKKLLLFTVLLGTSILVSLLSGCSNNNTVELGDLVTVEYTGTYLDNSVFEHKEVTIQAGKGEIIKGIDNAIINMKTGKTKNIKITPELGYGDRYNKNDLQKIAKFIFDKLGIPIEINKTVKLDKITGVIKSTEKDSNGNEIILFDINPLETRQNTNYEITIKSINKTNQDYKL